jgi:hypothetical protein
MVLAIAIFGSVRTRANRLLSEENSKNYRGTAFTHAQNWGTPVPSTKRIV